MTAYNRHADSLSFQPSFLNHGGAGSGGRSWRKNKKSLRVPQASLVGEAKQAGFRSGAPAQKRGAAAPSSGRVERRTLLLTPARRASSPGIESQRGHGDPQGAPAVRCGLHSSSSSPSWPGRSAR